MFCAVLDMSKAELGWGVYRHLSEAQSCLWAGLQGGCWIKTVVAVVVVTGWMRLLKTFWPRALEGVLFVFDIPVPCVSVLLHLHRDDSQNNRLTSHIFSPKDWHLNSTWSFMHTLAPAHLIITYTVYTGRSLPSDEMPERCYTCEIKPLGARPPLPDWYTPSGSLHSTSSYHMS